MPTHLNFRWNYDALVPALLYFDSVTFVNDDVGVRDKLVDPATLTGCDPDSFVEGFAVQQHRYYWPMRELIQEGVISLRPMETTMMPMTLRHPFTGELQIGWKDRFQEMLDREDPRARKFLYVANRYHRFIVPPSPNSKDEPIGDAPSIDISNALEVALWTRDAIRRRSTGQRRVAIHPEGQVAMDLAIEIFEDINKEMRPTDPDTADWIRQDQGRTIRENWTITPMPWPLVLRNRSWRPPCRHSASTRIRPGWPKSSRSGTNAKTNWGRFAR